MPVKNFTEADVTHRDSYYKRIYADTSMPIQPS